MSLSYDAEFVKSLLEKTISFESDQFKLNEIADEYKHLLSIFKDLVAQKTPLVQASEIVHAFIGGNAVRAIVRFVKMELAGELDLNGLVENPFRCYHCLLGAWLNAFDIAEENAQREVIEHYLDGGMNATLDQLRSPRFIAKCNETPSESATANAICYHLSLLDSMRVSRQSLLGELYRELNVFSVLHPYALSQYAMQN